jgi:hypothetical protein
VHHPWPGEAASDFYQAIVDSGCHYPRSALETLIRILSEHTIRASKRHMPGNICAVSFSSLGLAEAVKLMRWRARYREMTFEPYGIGIKQTAAGKAGINKVYYGNPEMVAYLEPDERPYFQSLGLIGDWEKESEYRHLGSLDLRQFDPSDIMAIVKSRHEIEKVQRIFDGKVLALFD